MKILAAISVGFLVLTSLAEEPATGAIQGLVRFTGAVPAAKRIQTTDGGVIFHSDLLVDPKSKGLRYVTVVLENPPPARITRNDTVLIDQRDMVFVPRVVAVQDGQKVRFENNDLVNHCVQSNSVTAENAFNVVTVPNQPYEHRFKTQKHPIVIGCPIHAWMRAWIQVVPHAYFAVTDAHGAFRIDKLPPGKYTLAFTHFDTGLKEKRTVEVGAGKTAVVELEWKTTPRPQD